MTAGIISNLTITGGNSSDGGGIDNAGNLTVTNCTISANFASYNGGGIDNAGTGTPTVSSSTLSGNSADNNGGGIWNDATVSACTFFGNAASIDATSVDGVGDRGWGGGIGNDGQLTLTNSTLTGNSANNGYRRKRQRRRRQ